VARLLAGAHLLEREPPRRPARARSPGPEPLPPQPPPYKPMKYAIERRLRPLTGRVLAAAFPWNALLCGRRFAVPEVTPVAGHGAEDDRQGTSARTIRMPSGSSVHVPVPRARGPGAHHPRSGADLGSLPRPPASFQPR